MKSKLKSIDKKQLLGGIALFVLILFLVALNLVTRPTLSVEPEKFIYLSDIPYISDQSSVGWGSITLDANLDSTVNNGLIALIVDGEQKTFLKGVSAHATSTLVYDISDYDFDYFTSYIGVDAGRGSNGNGVKFSIYTSIDGVEWELETPVSEVLKGDSEAWQVKIDIQGRNYLKLYAYNNGNDTSDHAVYANAKLIKEDYVENTEDFDFIKTVEELDAIIKNTSLDKQLDNNEYILLQREFVNNVGYDFLQQLAHLDKDYENTLRWLIGDEDNLKMYVLGGSPDGGSYYNSLKVLSQLYNATYEEISVNSAGVYNYTQTNKNKSIKDDMNNKTLTNNPWNPSLTKGEVYKKMVMSLALTHSTAVGYWAQINHPSNRSDALERYRIFKYLYDNGKFVVSERQDQTTWYEALEVEEMRYVMNSIVDNEEIIWFNEYTQTRIDANPGKEETYLQPHTYIAYVWPNFANPIYHDPANYEYFDELFDGIFTKYGVTYSTSDDIVYKAWMSMRNKWGTGAVCGGISKLGTHIRAAHGTPASVISQPGHAAIIYYRKDANGYGYWSMDNDVSGWAQSGKTERLSIRMPLGWGNDSYVSGWAATYILLAQEALNDYENYEKAEEILMLADIYKDDVEKQEEIYRKALKVQSINIDAWYGLIKLYKTEAYQTYIAKKGKTKEEVLYSLAKEITENLIPFPLPMYNLLSLIKSELTSVEYEFKYTLLLTSALTDSSNLQPGEEYVPGEVNNVFSPSISRSVGKYLLGQTDTSLASFSFDGEDAGSIVLSSRFDGNGIRWNYSIDGKNSWQEVSFSADEDHKWKLTEAEINAISEDNDIYIHIVGTNYDEDNLYKIDITKGEVPSTYYANDLENRVVGVGLTTEWRFPGTDEWTNYESESPDLTGNKVVEIRIGATGTCLASESVTYTFTEDNQPITRRYVPVSHLSIESVSTEATSNSGAASNAIDGNYNTRYHSDWSGNDTERYMVIKLDTPMYISAVEFVPAGGGNGKIYDGSIYGSVDGETWVLLSEQKNLSYTNKADTIEDAIANIKSFEIDEPQKVQYIKIVADRTNGNWFTAREFNLYQDLTNNPQPTAGIAYSTTDPTNENVVARLVNPSTDIRITNNGGSDTYTFTKNGSFEFKFVDVSTGQTGTAKAVVDWIDREAPTAKIEYSTTSPTRSEVDAKLVDISEEVEIINNNGQDIYTFSDNGTFTFEIQDKAGNVSEIEAKVTWIDLIPPEAEITYSIEGLTNQNVVATISNENEKIMVINNGGKNTYTFKQNGTFTFQIQDEAGNTNSITATVGWIDKTAPTGQIVYSTVKKTSDPVTATIKNFSEEVKIINNDGSDTYTFDSNGTFTFEIQDEAGNIGKIVAKVDWIEEEVVVIPPRTTVNASNTTTTTATVSNNSGSNTTTKNTSTLETSKTTTKVTSANENKTTEVIKDEVNNKAKNKTWLYLILASILVILLIFIVIVRKRQNN